jgi:acetyltransferase
MVHRIRGNPCRLRSSRLLAPVRDPAKDRVRVALSDARLVTIRPILPSDLDALRRFFTALSRATLRFRFHSSINELPEHLLRGFMVSDLAHSAFVAEICDCRAEQPTVLVAEARFVRRPDSESAEFALVVADNWRRIGLGTTLTRILAQRARFAGVRRLWGDVLEDNKAMRGLAHSLGARLSRGMGCLRLSLEV